jgi:hypothetical protein
MKTLEEYLESNIRYLLKDKYDKDKWIISSYDDIVIKQVEDKYKVYFTIRDAEQYDKWLQAIHKYDRNRLNLNNSTDRCELIATFSKQDIALFVLDTADYFGNED